ncbi:MBOAT family O-acyltransferase [Mangrovimonas cancribranchiae]|uniref:MBOAT family O-acyltransferase n=1 Tax=Mangrovimonas cancribranchiae TaxID=3080055 RepID=A0AAU6P9K9_9FLAO
MIFNSLDFAVFLPIVFLLYWFVFNKNHKAQNVLIVVASYFFYGYWDWRFLSLIAFSTLVDFFVGQQLVKTQKKAVRKGLLLLSLLVNLGLLGFFKYYNFFVDNFVSAFSFFGFEIPQYTLHIILPVGISFYTFQTLSYTIDVYREKIEPTKNIVAFAAFVSFFPQLVAGPIERATHLLPQFLKERQFNYVNAVDGLRQILWGLFKKIVVADNCARIVNTIFNDYETHSGSTLLLGAVLFAFQIYGDFSGYSDIAIGTSRLFGFDLKQNFAFPYFSRDIAEFWRRWHISLSTWFRDYLYIPLGGSRGTQAKVIRNVFIIFLVSGFWHGANWTFIVWGGLNALYFLPLMLANINRHHTDIVASTTLFPSIKECLQITVTFGVTVLAWVFFRSENIHQAWSILSTIFSHSFFTIPTIRPKDIIVLITILLLVEWFGRKQKHALAYIPIKHKFLRWGVYYVLILIIITFSGTPQEFIYFQF